MKIKTTNKKVLKQVRKDLKFKTNRIDKKITYLLKFKNQGGVSRILGRQQFYRQNNLPTEINNIIEWFVSFDSGVGEIKLDRVKKNPKLWIEYLETISDIKQLEKVIRRKAEYNKIRQELKDCCINQVVEVRRSPRLYHSQK
jgi:hypothetical protein